MGKHTLPHITPLWMTGNLLVTGEEVFDREFLSSSALALTSGQIRFTYFTARKSETINNIRFICGSTAAGATPTLTQLGIYSIASNGAGTLVGSTDPLDLTLFNVANAVVSKALIAPMVKNSGQRYALGVLVISGAAMPTMVGHGLSIATEPAIASRMTGAFSGQASLPASFADASLVTSGNRPYAALLP